MPTAPIPLLLAAGLAGGAVAGVGLERAGVLSPLAEPEAAAPAAMELDRVPVLDCPDGAVVAALARGDRVVATATTADGDWVEIRSPVALDGPAWLAAGSLRGDRPFDGLPTHDCERVGPTTSTATTSTTTSSSSTSTTGTTAPAATTTTAPVGDSVAPVITSVVATPSSVVELPNGCNATGEVTVLVVVTDEGGVVAVSYAWTTGDGGSSDSGPLSSVQDDRWGGRFPVPTSAVPAAEFQRELSLTVTALDAAGNEQTSEPVPVTVRDSEDCLD